MLESKVLSLLQKYSKVLITYFPRTALMKSIFSIRLKKGRDASFPVSLAFNTAASHLVLDLQVRKPKLQAL